VHSECMTTVVKVNTALRRNAKKISHVFERSVLT